VKGIIDQLMAVFGRLFLRIILGPGGKSLMGGSKSLDSIYWDLNSILKKPDHPLKDLKQGKRTPAGVKKPFMNGITPSSFPGRFIRDTYRKYL